MNPNLLKTFVAVARSGSITRAADRLNVTQPTVTGHIQSLEAQFEAPLLERGARGVTLTDAGEELLRDVAGHLEAAEGAFERLRSRSTAIKGTVRFGGPAEFIGEKLPPVFAALARAGLDLRITLGGRERISAAFQGNLIDLGITASEPQSPALGFAPVFQERLILVASPAVARVTERQGITKDTFPDLDFVAYDKALPLVRTYGIAVFGVSIENRAVVAAPSLTLVRDVVAAGMGVSVLPSYLCQPALASGALVQIHKPARVPINELFLVWRKEALRQPRIALARDRFVGALSEIDQL
ncbi:LysR family transcriptional regulator [Litoreibacter roseus]|uniref:Transcriptional regulator n=1 Tax=Litoreibacter roseus TaxID=2601869 RepID=A0A6N6JJM9_9RHOB|nr:LysR family transcriptional regulator [Litoreibacter roseus]GFE65649.1 transcriptional regulator [Litoreibacter roseus]